MTTHLIQTSLLDRDVYILFGEYEGKRGTIRTLRIDKDGDVKYTIETPGGKLVTLYDSAFTLIQ